MGFSVTFNHYYDAFAQKTCPVLLKLKEMRNEPDFFQKVCQVVFAALQYRVLTQPQSSDLSRFCFALLSTANMHDVLRFVQQPIKWFCPINARTIDEEAVLNDLTSFLRGHFCQASASSGESEESSHSDDELRNIARECIRATLNEMNAHNDAYRNFDKFKEKLQKCLQEVKFKNYSFAEIDLNNLDDPNYDLSQWIRPVSFLQKAVNALWAIVDLGCLALYFRDVDLLDTAKWANRVGQYSSFKWVKEHQLATWAVGFVSLAFLAQFVEACRKLHDEALTSKEKFLARSDAVTSFAETILYGVIYLNMLGQTKINNANLHLLAIFVKSLGLLSLALRPKHEFFQKPENA